jgi:UPF0755 protein
MRFRPRIAFVIVAAILGAGGIAGALVVRQQLLTPYPARQIFAEREAAPIEIPRGLGTRGIVRLLRERNVIANEYLTLAFIGYSGYRNKLRAGEYMFDRPMTAPEVVEKLVKGIIYLHKFTVAEGLTLDKTAAKWEEQGFGSASDFLKAATNAVPLIRDLDDKAASLEGYLFPETYLLARGTTDRQALEIMVRRFRQTILKLNPPNVRETVTLASIVESEAAHDDERALIASVYRNRLDKMMLLQCDPTVIYALERIHKYAGALTLNDLRVDSPYNTYRYAGLPPGPIANPGLASLAAAVNPASTGYLYFVRTENGRHTFSTTLAEHNRAVTAYRAMARRAK